MHAVLFGHFNELCEDIVAFCAVFWKLVAGVALEDISTSKQEFFDNFEVVAMRSQVESGPLVKTTLRVKVKSLQVAVLQNSI